MLPIASKLRQLFAKLLGSRGSQTPGNAAGMLYPGGVVQCTRRASTALDNPSGVDFRVAEDPGVRSCLTNPRLFMENRAAVRLEWRCSQVPTNRSPSRA